MWIREGYCCQCGDCCKGSPPDFGPAIAGYCPAFRWESEGKGICLVRNTGNPYWQMACKLWPEHPNQIKDKPRCTYSFKWVEDGD